jgi:hypothetical protein
MALATHDIQAGNLADARYALVPVAYQPHGGPLADSARQVIDAIDAGSGQEELLTLLQPADAE